MLPIALTSHRTVTAIRTSGRHLHGDRTWEDAHQSAILYHIEHKTKLNQAYRDYRAASPTPISQDDFQRNRLVREAQHCAQAHWRETARMVEVEDGDLPDIANSADDPEVLVVAEEEAQAERDAIWGQRRALALALKQSNPEDAWAFILHHERAMKYEDIGRLIGGQRPYKKACISNKIARVCALARAIYAQSRPTQR